MSERKTVTFGGEHGFGDVEFRNIHPRLLSSGLLDLLDAVSSAQTKPSASAAGLDLIDVWGGLFALRCSDRKFFASVKTRFPERSAVLDDGSVLPIYVGEFEKDGSAYAILICDERLSDSDSPHDWIPGTYRNMRFDPRS